MSADGTSPTYAPPSLSSGFLDELDHDLADADALLADRYPGDPGTRQPLHTVYVNADLADSGLIARWAAGAREVLAVAAPDPVAAAALGLPAVDEAVLGQVRAKLDAEPIEDLRLDFEDGYGNRLDDEEDRDASRVAALLPTLLADPNGPLLAGIRFKSLERPTRRRGLRTLDLVVTGMLAAGPLPEGFLVTLPKVTSVDQVTAMVKTCEELERVHALPAGALRFEIQVETTQAILGADGDATVAAMIGAAGARCVALHYGTFDYSAACGVAAAEQSLAHPVADHAKAVMQVAAAGTGVRLSDGSTNVMPVGSPDEIRAAVALHAALVTRSLRAAYYQGWDMHPGHLVSRYLATYAFYRAGLPAAAARLRAYLNKRSGGVVDEPATAQALAAFLMRGVHCGAIDDAEVLEQAGVGRATIDAMARRKPLPA
ncbi:MAG TPA: aldolase [Nakamurella sp.]